jgi:hypothetical protein
LLGRDKRAISRHLKPVFDNNALGRHSVVAKNATTAADVKSYQVVSPAAKTAGEVPTLPVNP